MLVVLRRTTLFQGSNSCVQVEDFHAVNETRQPLIEWILLKHFASMFHCEFGQKNVYQTIGSLWLKRTACYQVAVIKLIEPDTSCLQVHSELKIQCNYWIRFQYRQAFRKLRPRSRRFQAIDSIEPTLRPSKCDLSEGNLVFNVWY